MDESKLTDADKLYFPHCWTKRLTFNDILEKHVKFFEKGSEKAKKLMKCEFDVPYGLKPREKYDIFGTDLAKDSPILIHIHGGYWQVKEITHTNQAFLAPQFYKHNVKVIAVGHELCPENSLKDIVKGLETAMKKCLEYVKINKSRGIFLSGHSTGAHLVASLFLKFIGQLSHEDMNLIKAVFLTCGLYDLRPLVTTVINAGLQLDVDTANSLSPHCNELNIPKSTEFHIVIAEHESPAFVKQAKDFYEKLIKMDLECKYHTVHETDHFDVIEKLAEEEYELLEIMVAIIKKLTTN